MRRLVGRSRVPVWAAVRIRRILKWRLAALALVAGLAAPISQASAAPHPGVVVWSGLLGSETALHGVVLQPNGHGTIMSVNAADRGRGTARTVGAFNPSPAVLARIRSAAVAMLQSPRVSIGPSGPAGLYTSVTVQLGARKHVVVALNPLPSPLVALLAAFDGGLPSSAQFRLPGLIPAADRPRQLRAKGAPPLAGGDPFAGVLIKHSEGTAPCVPGQAATSVGEPVSLKDAAADGLVTLTTKGGFGGDTVAVDANWGPLPNNPPVVLRMNFEITPPPELSAADQSRVVNGIKSAVEARLGGLKASDGTPLTVQLNVRQRDPTQPPTPCFHEIKINQDANADTTTAINTKLNMTGPFQPDPLPGWGEWSTLGTSWQTGGGFSAKAADIWTHEVLHFAGLDEAYHPAFQVDDVIKDFPADARFQNNDDVLAWARLEEAFKGLDVNSGRFRLHSDPGHEHDYMGRCPDSPPCRVDQAAVDMLVAAGKENIDITGSPGDLLLNKDSSQQSLGVGTNFHLIVHRGTPAHVDGLVAYCIDLGRHSPDPGVRLDVLGRAGDQSDPSMQALQAVLDEVAREQPAPLDTTIGGQVAVWRVTDDLKSAEDSQFSRAILDAAQIPPDATYVNPHYVDPNSSGAGTSAVSPTDVLAATPLPAAGPPPVVGKPRLLTISAHQLSARGRLLLVEIAVSSADTLTISLQRAQRKHLRTIVRQRSLRVHEGENFVSLSVPPLRRGSYRLVVAGTAGRRTTSLRVRR
jgi:hypothetical protein